MKIHNCTELIVLKNYVNENDFVSPLSIVAKSCNHRLTAVDDEILCSSFFIFNARLCLQAAIDVRKLLCDVKNSVLLIGE